MALSRGPSPMLSRAHALELALACTSTIPCVPPQYCAVSPTLCRLTCPAPSRPPGTVLPTWHCLEPMLSSRPSPMPVPPPSLAHPHKDADAISHPTPSRPPYAISPTPCHLEPMLLSWPLPTPTPPPSLACPPS